MIAYFVHDERQRSDTIYIPDRGCFVAVDAGAMERFIAVKPDFAGWTGAACGFMRPEEFGTVIATRDDAGDVCIVKPELWRERMLAILGNPLAKKPG
jgi:hypothetical protein